MAVVRATHDPSSSHQISMTPRPPPARHTGAALGGVRAGAGDLRALLLHRPHPRRRHRRARLLPVPRERMHAYANERTHASITHVVLHGDSHDPSPHHPHASTQRGLLCLGVPGAGGRGLHRPRPPRVPPPRQQRVRLRDTHTNIGSSSTIYISQRRNTSTTRDYR